MEGLEYCPRCGVYIAGMGVCGNCGWGWSCRGEECDD